MALLVIHLWGKFWMAAWRGRRAMTWITGVVAFVASVVECFTGYLSQQNFDSQWIATNGKDAFNEVGVGAFFNLMNFGQMLMWHIVLLPIILIAIVGAHVLLVRVRGVSHPLPVARPRGLAARRAAAKADRAAWRGPTRRYDILKEGTIATVVILVLTVGLAGLLSSPNVPPVTVRSWVQVVPADFLATAATELNGTSLTATYGPPYNNNGTPQSATVRPGEHRRACGSPSTRRRPSCSDPLAKRGADRPGAGRGPGHLQRRVSRPAGQVGDQLRERGHQGQVRQRSAGASRGAMTAPCRLMLATELTLARSGAIDAALVAPSRSTAPTSPSRCCSSRTAPTTPTRPPPSTSPVTSGA